MNDNRYEIRLSGSGGQGIITAAIILAEAAGVFEKKYVCQTQSYGPEARGGKSKAEVIISSHPIDYPKVTEMDIFLAMNQASCDAYFYDFKPDGLLLVDSTFVKNIPTNRVISIPFTQIAREEIGREFVANMVALGALGRLCHEVSLQSIKKAVLSRVPPDTADMNQKALEAGILAAEKINVSLLPRSITPDEEVEI
jgi:2-oxoglutarate ferredoxin oxidoreductase subunit gamma